MHPGEHSASVSEHLAGLFDSELAAAFVHELDSMYARGGRIGDEIRTNEELRAILREFTRRSDAVVEARARYRRRHLSLVTR
jgi:predicted component of type VI protein secretion system